MWSLFMLNLTFPAMQIPVREKLCRTKTKLFTVINRHQSKAPNCLWICLFTTDKYVVLSIHVPRVRLYMSRKAIHCRNSLFFRQFDMARTVIESWRLEVCFKKQDTVYHFLVLETRNSLDFQSTLLVHDAITMQSHWGEQYSAVQRGWIFVRFSQSHHSKFW
jgi:hypothetical protein